ncbi:protein TsetseEP isoform X2 [Archocentrus centrarchus]|uniref:protein TsetseEP isoform X2 n=1 Tax=Archocentrus centrarchus TaxID=63155 RepID=UPI0011E9F88B|nr:protein TsetseEP-like isoform X2 [Archocentrus centrarchus]XP_030590954.1 protein TsetseEP-like isoform X2 [Archocentrus centrarchus]
MDLDPAVIIPAILFTVVAIYFATSLLSRKLDPSSSSSAGSKKSKLGYEDDLPPQGAPGEEPEAFPQPEPPAPAVEDIGAAEKIQNVPKLQAFPEPVKITEAEPEAEEVLKEVTEPISAQEPVAEPVKVPQTRAEGPAPEAVPEPLKEPELVPEPVISELVSEAVSTPEPVLEPDEVAAVSESTPESESGPEQAAASEPVPESKPVAEPLSEPPGSALEPVTDPEPALVPEEVSEVVQKSVSEPEELIEQMPGPSEGFAEASTEREPEPEPETILDDDVAAGDDDDDVVSFTAGIKQSKLAVLMTQEDMEEEQRIELTSDFTSL